MMNQKKYLIGLVLVVLGLVVLAGCTSSRQYESGSVQNSERKSSELSDSGLKIISHDSRVEGDYYKTVVVYGIAQNVGNRELSYAEIDVKFYDKNGAVLGNWLDNINDLEPGEKWSFEVSSFGIETEDIASYKISVGDTFSF